MVAIFSHPLVLEFWTLDFIVSANVSTMPLLIVKRESCLSNLIPHRLMFSFSLVFVYLKSLYSGTNRITRHMCKSEIFVLFSGIFLALVPFRIVQMTIGFIQNKENRGNV